MLSIIIMIVGGFIASMNLIGKLVPKSKTILEKLMPISGIVGIALIVWSIKGLITIISAGVFPLVSLSILIIQLVVGILLSFSLLSKFIFKLNTEKSDEFRAALANFQIPMGLILIVYGLLVLLNIL